MQDIMQGIMGKAIEYLTRYGLNIVAAILIFFVGKWLASVVALVLEKLLLRSRVDKTLSSFAKNISYFAMLAFVVIAALNKLGVETSSFIAIVGAAGLAVGLALQGSLSNFAAGVMMMVFRPFAIGDYIQAGGGEGTVSEIQIFTTVLMTKDNKRVIIPNAKITGDKISVCLVTPEAGGDKVAT
jgi:small conductance mechanosensitive channel